jgi:hypothetical protein
MDKIRGNRLLQECVKHLGLTGDEKARAILGFSDEEFHALADAYVEDCKTPQELNLALRVLSNASSTRMTILAAERSVGRLGRTIDDMKKEDYDTPPGPEDI